LDVSFLPAERQFLLSEAVPLGIIEVLDEVISEDFEGIDSNRTTSARKCSAFDGVNDMPSKPVEKLSIKWPNDIFNENRKLAGILINSTIKANMMDVSVIGIGLNVNQMHFQDWPTHPISLKQIMGKSYNLQPLLEQIVEHILIKVEQLKSSPAAIEQNYLKRLYRYRTWAEYEVGGKNLWLFMTGIDPFGRLQLVDEANNFYCFDIKKIKFLL